MKEWKKPEIVDLDVKFTLTEDMLMPLSGGTGSGDGGSGDGTNPTNACTECGHTLDYPWMGSGWRYNHHSGCSKIQY